VFVSLFYFLILTHKIVHSYGVTWCFHRCALCNFQIKVSCFLETLWFLCSESTQDSFSYTMHLLPLVNANATAHKNLFLLLFLFLSLNIYIHIHSNTKYIRYFRFNRYLQNCACTFSSLITCALWRGHGQSYQIWLSPLRKRSAEKRV
jgi:hypothetical protein